MRVDRLVDNYGADHIPIHNERQSWDLGTIDQEERPGTSNINTPENRSTSRANCSTDVFARQAIDKQNECLLVEVIRM
jgi:hypothetical protein